MNISAGVACRLCKCGLVCVAGRCLCLALLEYILKEITKASRQETWLLLWRMRKRSPHEDRSRKHCCCCSFLVISVTQDPHGACAACSLSQIAKFQTAQIAAGRLLAASAHVSEFARGTCKLKNYLKRVKLCAIATSSHTHTDTHTWKYICTNLYTTYCEKTECCMLFVHFVAT